jgi:hypothetical protein
MSKIDETSKITYEQFGKDNASLAKGEPQSLNSSLNIIFNEIIKESKLDENQKKDKIQSLLNDKTVIDTSIIEKNTEVQTKEVEKIGKQKELNDINEGKGHVDIIPFVISSLITFILTFFLWIFYSGSSYGAMNEKIFQGKIDGLSAIFTSLGYLIDFGSGIEKSFYGLFPIIFIALGFLIHDSLANKKYIKIFSLLTLTFFVDVIIGYLITQNIYRVAASHDLSMLPWETKFIFNDPNFYLILTCGFASYIIWGFLLHSSLQKYNDMQPTVRQKQLLMDIGNIDIDIAKLNGEKERLENKKNDLLQEIDDLRKNVVYLRVTHLKALIGSFINGWSAWIQLMRPTDATSLITSCNQISEQWLTETINKNNNGVTFKE